MPIGDEVVSLAGPRIKLENPPPETDHREIGVDLNLPFMSPYRNSWEVPREEDVSVEKLVAMRKTDGQARALYRLITLPIMSAFGGSTFLPADGKEGGKDEAEFIDKVFNLPPHAGGMEIPFRRVMEHFLLAVFDGFSVGELVLHAPKVGPLKGKWTIAKIAPRPSETCTFEVDNRGKFKGIRQRAYVNGHFINEVIPKERALYYAANEVEAPFYGHSFFRAAFLHWDKKVRLYYLGHLMAQRSAVGTRVGHYPKNADPKKVRNFIKQVSDLGTNQWMAVEEAFEVDSLKEGSSTDVLGLINHHNSQMSKSVLADFMDKNQGAGANDGSFVDFGQQSDALFQLMLDSIIGELEDLINYRVIPDLIDWNFGTGMYPKFKWGPVSQDQKAMLVDLFKQLMVTANQGNITPDAVFALEKKVMGEYAGLPLDYDKLDRERQEQLEKDKEQQEQMMAAQQAAMAPPTTSATGASLEQPLDIPDDLLPTAFQQ